MTTLAELGVVAKGGLAQSTEVYQTPEWKRKAILATNAAGVVAAPAAVGLAYRAAMRNEGGTPRQITDWTGRRLERSGASAAMRRGRGVPADPRKPVVGPGGGRIRVGGGLRRIAHALNTKAGRAGKVGAAMAGSGMLGLQVAQSSGDFLAAQENSRPRRKPGQQVSKARRDPLMPGSVSPPKPGPGEFLRIKGRGYRSRLKPNPTQLKTLAVGAAVAGGAKLATERRKAKQRAYDDRYYYGGY